MVSIYPKTTLKILQLLLRCGMICREELNVVLEMMPAVTDSQGGAAEASAEAERPQREVGQQQQATQCLEAAAPQLRQKKLIPELTIEFH